MGESRSSRGNGYASSSTAARRIGGGGNWISIWRSRLGCKTPEQNSVLRLVDIRVDLHGSLNQTQFRRRRRRTKRRRRRRVQAAYLCTSISLDHPEDKAGGPEVARI